MAQPVEDGFPFPVALGRHLVEYLENRRLGAERRVDLGGRPDVEFAFLVLAVGVETAAEPALTGQHLAFEPADRLGDALGIERVADLLPDEGQQIDELGIVVEHLFEMRRQPARID